MTTSDNAATTSDSNATDYDYDYDYSTGEIGVNEERIIEELIFDQAEGLVDGIRECAQNGIDAPGSDRVEIELSPDQTVVTDNGDGMDLSDESVRQFLTTLANSTKIDDPEYIGQFGIGFGQAMAMGHVTVHTQDTKVEFDAKHWFREYRLYDVDAEYDGFKVVIDHYEDDVPDAGDPEWDDYRSDLIDRFKYMELVQGVTVTVNGDRISNEDPANDLPNATVYETDNAYMVLRHQAYDWIKVYSAGLFVTERRGHGIGGYVITKENLTLNTARNSIKSACDLWPTVEEDLTEARVKILDTVADERLTDNARRAVVRMARSGDGDTETEQSKDRDVLKKANGEMVSISDIESSSDVYFADQSDKAAGKLADLGKLVLMADDGATHALRKGAERNQLAVPESKSVQATAAAMSIKNGYEIVDDTEFYSKPLAIARILRQKMAPYSPVSMNRAILAGEDSTANAWTIPDSEHVDDATRARIDRLDNDFDSFVAITDSAYSTGASEVLVLELWRIIAHEFAHTEDSTNEPNHGSAFSRRFRKIIDKTQPAAVELLNEIRNDGVATTFERYDHQVPHSRDNKN